MFSQEILDSITVSTHSSICIRREKVIYIDPLNIEGAPHDADLILITHPHFDHYSKKDIAKLMREDTVIAAPQELAGQAGSELGHDVMGISPGQKITLCDIPIEAVPAYNKAKPNHPKAKGWLGYVLTIGETRVYITGDTDDIPEARAVSCDILLLPVGGTYTMNAAEAAALTNAISPHTVIPVHYGLGLGGKQAPETFRAAVESGIETRILDTVFSKVMLPNYLKIAAFVLIGFLVGFLVTKLL